MESDESARVTTAITSPTFRLCCLIQSLGRERGVTCSTSHLEFSKLDFFQIVGPLVFMEILGVPIYFVGQIYILSPVPICAVIWTNYLCPILEGFAW